MRIAIVTQYYVPETGAPQARLSALASRLRERGHQVTVLTAMPNYPAGRVFQGYSGLWRREELDGVAVLRTWIYPSKSLGVRRLASYFSFVLSACFFGALLLPRVDVLMTESPPLFLGIAGYVLSRLKRARWIFNVSDLWPESAVRLGVVSPGWSLRLAYALEAFCYRRAWLVTGQSREILRNIRRRFPEVPNWHLSNGVTPDLFSPSSRSPESRRKLGGGECIAVYAGLHGIAQGLEQIVRAAAMLRDVKGLRFVLIGEGPEKARLMGMVRDQALENLSFLDAVSREEVPALLASADLVLAPLKQYLPGAVPSKIYEAMAVGLPVVLSGDGEAGEIVTRSGAGVVVPPGDAGALAAAIRKLAGDEKLRRDLGAAGLQAAQGEFNRRNIIDRFAVHLEHSVPAFAIQGNTGDRHRAGAAGISNVVNK